MPTRFTSDLSSYFRNKDRSKVKFFVRDMWKPFSEIATIFMPNAVQVVDKYHFIRQVIWAFETVRKEEQKKFNKTHRVYFKRSKSLLNKQYAFLSQENKEAVRIMLDKSSNLDTAHRLKEFFSNSGFRKQNTGKKTARKMDLLCRK